jgi:predicted ATPase
MFPVMWGLWLHHKVRSELATAQEVAMELARLARLSNDPDLALQGHQALAMTAFCRGQLETSLQHVEMAASLYDRQRHATHSFLFGQDPGVICKSIGAVVLWLLGYPDAAARQCTQAIRMSLDLSPSSRAVAYFFAAIVHQLRCDMDQTRQFAQRCGEISTEHGFSFWLVGSSVLRGWSMAAEGDAREGIAVMRQALIDWQAIGSITYRTYFLGLLAESLISDGAHEEGHSLVNEAMSLADKTDERFYEPELLRLKGRCLLVSAQDDDRSSLEDVRQTLERAFDLARRQNAKSLQLRVAISLTELEHRFQSEDNTARKRLADILCQITEGRQTRDLKEANALLGGAEPAPNLQ